MVQRMSVSSRTASAASVGTCPAVQVVERQPFNESASIRHRTGNAPLRIRRRYKLDRLRIRPGYRLGPRPVRGGSDQRQRQPGRAGSLPPPVDPVFFVSACAAHSSTDYLRTIPGTMRFIPFQERMAEAKSTRHRRGLAAYCIPADRGPGTEPAAKRKTLPEAAPGGVLF